MNQTHSLPQDTLSFSDFSLATTTSDHQSSSSMTELESTIRTMQTCGICADPLHYHSFQTVNFMLTGSVRTCHVCQTRLQSVLFASRDSTKQIVKCVACGILCHRNCAASRHTTWKEPCPVNKKQCELMTASWTKSGNTPGHGIIAGSLEESWAISDEDTGGCEKKDDDEQDVAQSTNNPAESQTPKDAPSRAGRGAARPPPEAFAAEPAASATATAGAASNENNASPSPMEWTSDGPPQHWASDNPGIVSTITIPTAMERSSQRNNNNNNSKEEIKRVDSEGSGDDEVHVSSLHHADHPFASVSRALQENIIAHFNFGGKSTTSNDQEKQEQQQETEPKGDDTETKQALSKKAEPQIPEPKKEESEQKPSTLVQLASATRTIVNLPGRLGMSAVAGGVAGGIAGLAMAGPAGAYAGYQLGEAAGVLGVILEGSVSIGVIVASVRVGSITAEKIQNHMEERRVLTMGEEGISRKVLLVRPNINVDPVWDEISLEAKQSAPKKSNGGGSFFFLSSNDDDATRERYKRDVDIIQPTENEIPTTDKVLLLASRILNDKTSIPGHVYRSLIRTFRERCSEPLEEYEQDGVPSRRRRDDAHAVIKHVTATLLEVRPGFGQTAALTELTATAVEGFVFGKVYELVMEEIQREMSQRDADLKEKIAEFERTQPVAQHVLHQQISQDALQSLRLLPASHTAVEKLNSCTTFLEQISLHFSSNSRGAVCADSLLKMVCQHIYVLVDHLDGINAEIAFLEEFARDEQLLRGKEGYALVTLQAALHFLNLCNDLENDIFEQDSDELNVPVSHSPSSTSAPSAVKRNSPKSSELGDSGELL